VAGRFFVGNVPLNKLESATYLIIILLGGLVLVKGFFGKFRGRYPDLGVRTHARTPKSGPLSHRQSAAGPTAAHPGGPVKGTVYQDVNVN